MKRRDIWTFFANPFVVLADIMVSLVFIITLFLLTTTIYNRQMALVVLRDKRRLAVSESLEKEFKNALQGARKVVIAPRVKYQYIGPKGVLLEVENDGSLQRFRFPSALTFPRGQSEFAQTERARAIATLSAFGYVLLKNRSVIKSLVIEGHATEYEAVDGASRWRLSEARAETVRRLLQSLNILRNVDERKPLLLTQFLKEQYRTRNASYDAQFNEWHAQEYQAQHVPLNNKLGVLPAAWVISSGRGDQVRREPVVEFKLEYTERNTVTLDDYIRSSALNAQTRHRAAEFEQQDITALRRAL